MPQLIPVNLHESLWGPASDQGSIWAQDLSRSERSAVAALAVARAKALGFEIRNGEAEGVSLDIASPAVVLDSEGRRGWVLAAIDAPHQPLAIEWRASQPNDSRDVWVTGLCGSRISGTHNYLPPQS